MTFATYHPSPASSLRHHLDDVSRVARAFAAKLFAGQARQAMAQEAANALAICASAKAKGRRELLAFANEYQSLSPNLAAELRSLAARD